VRADEVPPGTLRVASRLFLVVDVPDVPDGGPNGLALSGVHRLRDRLERDPVLDGTYVYIDVPPSPAAWLLGPEGTRRHYGNRDAVPEMYRAPGLVSETSHAEAPAIFHFRPDEPDPDFMASCHLSSDVSSEAFSICFWSAAYPPDPAILLEGTLVNPPPFADLHPRFEDVADRMREIAQCLDVTGEPPRDPVAWLREILREHPDLTGCPPA
jgi:hypothetical protein